MERVLVQILVVVATIHVRLLKTEVEKGSVWIVMEHGWVDPKGWGNPMLKATFFVAETERERG